MHEEVGLRRIYRVFLVMLLVAPVLVFNNSAHAQTLKSPSFEIDTFGFASNDSQFSVATPQITEGPTVVSVSGTSSIIQWKTDIISNSIVAYGLTTNYGVEAGQSEDQTKSHLVKLTSLSPNTTYHYQAKSINILGKVGRSKDEILTTANQLSVSEVQISDITLSSAIISWKTASILTSSIRYGKTTQYGSNLVDQSAGSTTTHTVRLSNLDSGSLYHFQIAGVDADNQPVNSDDYIFTTLTLPLIDGLTIGTITGNSAELSWRTNIPTDSFVSFWHSEEDETKAISQGSPDLTTVHHVVLTALSGKSEYNFRVIGRDTNGNRAQTNVLSFKTPIDTTPPQISEVKSEINTSAKDDSLQLVISWNTDEQATGQIEYTIGAVSANQYKSQSKEDTTPTINHVLIVTGLKASTNYHFRIKSVDLVGNVGYSSDYSILTPQKHKSLLEFIIGRLEDIFGWLRNIKIR